MPNEELYYLPASELLKYIQAEKERLIKEKVVKKSKPLPPITEEEKPYELPEDWEWTRLSDICSKITDGEHIKPKSVELGIPLLTAKNIRETEIIIDNVDYISLEDAEKSWNRCNPEFNDILICSRGTVGRNTLVTLTRRFCLMGNVILVKPFDAYVKSKYINYYLKTNFAQNTMAGMSGSTAVNALYLKDVNYLIIPVPPLYIQDQIVQQLEQLYETKDSLLSHAESQLNYTKKMREVLLQEAIRGELVPQDEDDEPASVLLEKIKTEKERLIKEKVIKKQKELPPITEDEKPYDLPSGWEWVRLGEISQTLNYGYTASATDIDTGVKMLRITDIQDNKVNWETVPFCEIDPEKLSSYILHPNDIVIARTGTVGKSFIIKDISCTSVFASYLIRVQLLENINATYVKKFIESPLYWDQLVDKTTGTGQPNVNATSLSQLILPLPPLAEQERIVAKLDELMANCDQLEAKAEEMKNYTMKLFEASLKEAFMPLNNNDEED